jgi:hypothetical protein
VDGTRPRDDDLDEAIRRLHRVLTDHKVATRAAFDALACEGRAYAQTPEGRRLLARLSRSETVTRLCSAWEIVSVGVVDEAPPRKSSLPSVALKSFARAALQPSFESRVHGALRPESSPRRRARL